MERRQEKPENHRIGDELENYFLELLSLGDGKQVLLTATHYAKGTILPAVHTIDSGKPYAQTAFLRLQRSQSLDHSIYKLEDIYPPVENEVRPTIVADEYIFKSGKIGFLEQQEFVEDDNTISIGYNYREPEHEELVNLVYRFNNTEYELKDKQPDPKSMMNKVKDFAGHCLFTYLNKRHRLI